MLAMLAASSVDVNAHDESGVTALHHAARAGSVKSIQALLQAGADVDPPNVHPIYHVYSAGPTPLIDAVKNGELAAVKALLKAGADLGCEDERNMTALAHAEHRRDIKCANALRAADKEHHYFPYELRATSAVKETSEEYDSDVPIWRVGSRTE
eukprot:7384880-Prymnesium_polylepis.1